MTKKKSTQLSTPRTPVVVDRDNNSHGIPVHRSQSPARTPDSRDANIGGPALPDASKPNISGPWHTPQAGERINMPPVPAPTRPSAADLVDAVGPEPPSFPAASGKGK